MEGTPEAKFFKEFKRENSPNEGDSNYFKTGYNGNYFLKPSDVKGQVLDWALNYLEQRKCPYSLSLSLAKTVSRDLSNSMDEHQGHTNGNAPDLSADKLHADTISQLHKLCENNPPEALLGPAELEGGRLVTSVCAIRNGRRWMEDRHVQLHNLNSVCNLPEGAPQYSYYAVFDGHAGIDSASYASAHLHQNIVSHPEFLTNTEKAIKEGFLTTDQQLLEHLGSVEPPMKSGCTALCALLSDKELYVAWLGDSQAYLVKQGCPTTIMSPHKPDRLDEKKRIEDAGGMVLFYGTWRVNGQLAVSRAFGDLEHKPLVSSVPDMVRVELDGTEDLLVLACDGLWDSMTMQDAVNTVRNHLVVDGGDPTSIAKILVHAAKDKGSQDNITAIVIFLRDPVEVANTLSTSTIPQLHNGNGTHQAPAFLEDTPSDLLGNLPTPPIDDLIAPKFENQTISEELLDKENISEVQSQLEEEPKDKESLEMSPDSEEVHKLMEDQKPENTSSDKELASTQEMVTKLATEIVSETIELAVSQANLQKAEEEPPEEINGSASFVVQEEAEEEEPAEEVITNCHNFAETEYPTITRVPSNPFENTDLSSFVLDDTSSISSPSTNPFLLSEKADTFEPFLHEASQVLPDSPVDYFPIEQRPSAMEESLKKENDVAAVSGLSEMEIKENEINARISSCEATSLIKEEEVKVSNELNLLLKEDKTNIPIMSNEADLICQPPKEFEGMSDTIFNPLADQEDTKASGEVPEDTGLVPEEISHSDYGQIEICSLDPVVKSMLEAGELEQVELIRISEEPGEDLLLNKEDVQATTEPPTREFLELAVSGSLEEVADSRPLLTEPKEVAPPLTLEAAPQSLLPLEIPEAGVQALSYEQSTSYTPFDESTSAESMPSEIIDYSEKNSENGVQKSPDPDATPLASPPIEPKPKEEAYSPNIIDPSLEEIEVDLRPKELELVNLSASEPEQPIAPVEIPEGVPEAEGVTEDSDSEKDGGWSYIKGDNIEAKPQSPPQEDVKKEESQEDMKPTTSPKAPLASKNKSLTDKTGQIKPAARNTTKAQKPNPVPAMKPPVSKSATLQNRQPLASTRPAPTTTTRLTAARPTPATTTRLTAAKPTSTRPTSTNTTRPSATRPTPTNTDKPPATKLPPTTTRPPAAKPPLNTSRPPATKPPLNTTRSAATRPALTNATTRSAATRPAPPTNTTTRTAATRPAPTNTTTRPGAPKTAPTNTARPAGARPTPTTNTRHPTASKPPTPGTRAATTARVSTTKPLATNASTLVAPKPPTPIAPQPSNRTIGTRTTRPPLQTRPARPSTSEPKLKPTTRPPAPQGGTGRPLSKTTLKQTATKETPKSTAGKWEPKAVPKKPASQTAVKPAEENGLQIDIPPMEGAATDTSLLPKEESVTAEESVTQNLLEI